MEIQSLYSEVFKNIIESVWIKLAKDLDLTYKEIKILINRLKFTSSVGINFN